MLLNPFFDFQKQFNFAFDADDYFEKTKKQKYDDYNQILEFALQLRDDEKADFYNNFYDLVAVTMLRKLEAKRSEIELFSKIINEICQIAHVQFLDISELVSAYFFDLKYYDNDTRNKMSNEVQKAYQDFLEMNNTLEQFKFRNREFFYVAMCQKRQKMEAELSKIFDNYAVFLFDIVNHARHHDHYIV